MKGCGLTFQVVGIRNSLGMRKGFAIDELCCGCIQVFFVGGSYAKKDQR